MSDGKSETGLKMRFGQRHKKNGRRDKVQKMDVKILKLEMDWSLVVNGCWKV